MLDPEPQVIDFSSYVAERARSFTGRGWLFEAIDRWLADPDEARFFLLVGEPGAGKTAVAARLALISSGSVPALEGSGLQPGFLGAMHFCSARDRRWVSPQTFAESLARQLSQRYAEFTDALMQSLAPTVSIHQEVQGNRGRVVGASIGTLVVTASPEDVFNRLVREPLEAVVRREPSPPVVILVDALDESRTYTGKITIAGLLTGAEDLPSSVRFIVTSRPETDILRSLRRSGPRECVISPHHRELDRPEDSPVLRDVQGYIEHVVRGSGPALHECLAADLPVSRFVATVRDKSEGNFLYVRHLLRMLVERRQPITVESLAGLPADLDGVYLEFLERIADSDVELWHQRYGTLLGVLAVSQVPLGEDRLRAFTSLEPAAVRSTLARLRELLDADDGVPASRRVYSLYHRSFGEFLLDRDRAEEYWLDAAPLHRLIADHYWRVHRAHWEQCDDYGLTNLAVHLFEAGDVPRLQSLVDEAWIQVRYHRRSFSYDGVLDDTDLAWRAAESLDGERVASGEPAPYLAEEARWALCVASIGSLVVDLPEDAVGSLVREGQWSPRQALAYLRRGPAGEPRSRVLATLARHLPEPIGIEAFSEATSSANQLADPQDRARVLTWLLPRLPQTLRPVALSHAVAAVRELQDTVRIAGGYGSHYASGSGERYVDTGMRTMAMTALGEALAEVASSSLTIGDVFSQLRAICELDDEAERTAALMALAGHLEWPATVPSSDLSHPTEVLLASLAGRSTIGDQSERARLTDSFGDAARADPRGELEERLAAVRLVDSPYFQLRTLAELVPRMAGSTLARALDVALGIRDPSARALALGALAPHLPEPLLREALSAPNTLAPMAPHLPEALLREAFEKARMRDGEERTQAMATLVPRLSEPELTEALTEVRNLIERGLGEEDYDAQKTFADLARHLPEPLAVEAFNKIKHLRERFFGERREHPPRFVALALLGLAPSLPELQRNEALSSVLRAVEGGGWFSFSADWGGAEQAVVTAIDLARRLPDSPLTTGVTTALTDRAISEARQAVHGRGYVGWNTRTRIRLLIRLLPHLPEPQLTEAARAVVTLLVEEFADQLPRAETATLGAYLPEALLSDVEPAITEDALPSYLPDHALPAAIEVARARKNRDWLFAATERMAGSGLTAALRAAKEIGGTAMQAEFMAHHAGSFARLEPVAAYAAWCETLRGMAELDRPTMLSHLRRLGPLVAALGGGTAVEGVIRAVHDVGRWWP